MVTRLVLTGYVVGDGSMITVSKDANLSPVHLLYDLTPPNLVTAVCTEVSRVSEDSTSKILIPCVLGWAHSAKFRADCDYEGRCRRVIARSGVLSHVSMYIYLCIHVSMSMYSRIALCDYTARLYTRTTTRSNLHHSTDTKTLRLHSTATGTNDPVDDQLRSMAYLARCSTPHSTVL
jgi:hypothetical protein